MDALWRRADSFEFVIGETPLSTWAVPLVVPAAYLAALEAGRRLVARRGRPFDLRPVVVAHNLALSLLSCALGAAVASSMWRLWSAHGLASAFCDEGGEHTRGRLIALVYVNYLFKYVELFDTVLLVLRGRPTPFLHVYHHAATLCLCWSQLRAESCVQSVPIVLNCWVHFFMYGYYGLHAMGVRVWWKRLLTSGQIAQFVVALVACVAALGSRAAHDLMRAAGYAGSRALPPRCWGSYEGAAIGIGVIASYLVLFVRMYRSTYGSVGTTKKD